MLRAHNGPSVSTKVLQVMQPPVRGCQDCQSQHSFTPDKLQPLGGPQLLRSWNSRVVAHIHAQKGFPGSPCSSTQHVRAQALSRACRCPSPAWPGPWGQESHQGHRPKWRGPRSTLRLGMTVDVFGWSNAAVMLLCSGVHSSLKDVPLGWRAAPSQQPPALPQPPAWESQGNTRSDPWRDRELPREKQRSLASRCSRVPPPALQPQCPLGSPQPSQPRTWGELMGQLFPWDATELDRSPPNTTSPGLGGVFWGASPFQGSKAPSRATRLARGQVPCGLYHLHREASRPESGSRAGGRVGTGVGNARAYLGQGPTGRAPVPHVPRALAAPKFLLRLLLRALYLPRLSLPSQPSPAGKAFPLKGEREGREEPKWRGGGGKKNKIKRRGKAVPGLGCSQALALLL